MIKKYPYKEKKEVTNFDNIGTTSGQSSTQTQTPTQRSAADMANYWLNEYESREPFSYNVNEDALYNQLRDQYIQMGNLASEDAMGKAVAMTGGYGNSYAQGVGQQTYNQYMNQLTGFIPELYDQAYNRYEQEGQKMLNMYDLYKSNAGSVSPGKSAPQYTTIDFEKSNQYKTSVADNLEAHGFKGFEYVLGDMVREKIDPNEALGFIKDQVSASTIKPTMDDLKSFADAMERNGFSSEEAWAFIFEWADDLGITGYLIDPNEGFTSGNGMWVGIR